MRKAAAAGKRTVGLYFHPNFRAFGQEVRIKQAKPCKKFVSCCIKTWGIRIFFAFGFRGNHRACPAFLHYLLRAAALRVWGLRNPILRSANFFSGQVSKGFAETGIMYTTVSVWLPAGSSTPDTTIHLSVLLLMAILAQALFAFVSRDLMSFSLFTTRHMLNLLKINE